jgi:hypothetical protein
MTTKIEIIASEIKEVQSKLAELLEKVSVATTEQTSTGANNETDSVSPNDNADKMQEEVKTVDSSCSNEKLLADVAEILELVKDSTKKDEINKELHEELQSYKSGFRRDILSSVLKNIIHWHSKISDQYTFYNKKQEEENIDLAALFPILLKEYKNLAEGLEDLLYDNDVETVVPAVGDEFNPRTQKSVRTIPPTDAGMERKIAECINVGFKDTITERTLKQPEVVVYHQIKVD